MHNHRVVVTGVGLISPVGTGTEETWAALLKGQSGIAPITLFDALRFSCRFAGEVKNFVPENYIDRKDIKKMGRFIQFAMAATQFAMAQSGLVITEENADRVGVYVGSGIGAFEVIEREHSKLLTGGPDRVSPFFINATIANLASGQISIKYGAAGPSLTVATACTTGAHGIGEAWHVIQRGDADVMICGGSEAAVTPLSVAGFASMRALSTRNDSPTTASRPWDTQRDGFVVGEGAGILILETLEYAQARGATILAEVSGYAANSDAFHTNAPPEDGRGVRKVMQLALKSAGIEPHQVGYLNAHATSTPLGDRAEAQAIAATFGPHAKDLLVSSTKSMTGHLLGGAGSLEAGITVLALRDQIAPPTTNLETPDENIKLNLVRDTPVPVAMDYAMTNSFGFGGTNASLIFRRWS
ncbi:beta-ketoacyl-ACP synthase II [Granulicella tundricola]|uniref:3-oxoacyl-[acyl-carrier-protein] synthase 2 n=1 Tax=Granulicella tundricola (strain ATCC BAA-1859 / DSM 23138 / MP5ACTX9) TaxID=1198114 RepID=E8WZE1_GRATM|nr:beta-ketoacyl-ACP synthase II [Granulicella tundricola]ADW68829.1 3-oxoacyl-(acyl-carrier-protein) synthase 2 [Granulicella tundricola MP5ACTX9]